MPASLLRTASLAFLSAWLAACQPSPPSALSAPASASAPASPPAAAAVQGFDVSHFQPQVDFSGMPARGVSFVFLKTTQGDSYVDPLYAPRLVAARTAGLAVGGYHYYDPTRPARSQLQHFVQHLAWQPGDLPPVVDIEAPLASTQASAGSGPSAADQALVQDLRCFLGTLQALFGVPPLLYTGKDYANAFLQQLDDHPLWLAEYNNQAQPALPQGWKRWWFWQHTQSGQLAGVQGPVDLSRFWGSADDLTRLRRTGQLATGGTASPPWDALSLIHI